MAVEGPRGSECSSLFGAAGRDATDAWYPCAIAFGASTAMDSDLPLETTSPTPLGLGAGLFVSGRTLFTTSGRGMLHGCQ